MYQNISFLLLAFANFLMIDAFSTDDCDHDKLSDETQKATTCLDVVVSKAVDEILDEYKAQLKSNNNIYKVSQGCKLLKKFSQDAEDCVTKLDASCFGNSYSQWIKAYTYYPEFFCDQLQFKNGSFPNLDPEKLEKLVNKLVIPKSDKECKPDDLRAEFDKLMSKIHREFGRMVEQIDPTKNERLTQPHLCVPLKNFLNTTMVENLCISQQEMNLMKHLVQAAYRTPMKAAIKIKGKFGNVERFVEVLEKTQVEIGKNDSFALGDYMTRQISISRNSTIAQETVRISDQIIDDFEAEECQGMMNTGFNEGLNTGFSLKSFPFLLIFLSFLALLLVY